MAVEQRPVRRVSELTRLRIASQIQTWERWEADRRQALIARQMDQLEWDIWATLPPSNMDGGQPHPEPPPPLSESEAYGLADVYTSLEPIDCPICGIPIKFDDVCVTLNCSPEKKKAPKHITCLGCSVKWFTECWSNCPQCRVPVKIIH